jgi:hypothetical protein
MRLAANPKGERRNDRQEPASTYLWRWVSPRARKGDIPRSGVRRIGDPLTDWPVGATHRRPTG